MHELSLCHSVLRVADRARAGRTVRAVNLRVGALRQVVPETMVYCWDLVTPGTGLDGARLVIEQVPISLRCRSCDATTTVRNRLILVCGECGDGAIDIITGEEFLLTTLDLAPLDEPTTTAKEHAHG